VISLVIAALTDKQPMETLEMVPRSRAANRAVEVPECDERSSAHFEALYEMCFPSVAAFVRKMHGSFQDAKDIFQDALVIYHEKCSDPAFQIQTPEAYILGIAKHLWVRKFKDDRRKVSADASAADISVPVDYYPSVNDSMLLKLLEISGEKCLSLLRFFYFEKATAKKLKERFGYQSEHSAIVQKYKCIEKLRETIKQKSIAYEDFLE
jgi:hypothetical protein